MNKIIVIQGPEGSGKTLLANSFYNGGKVETVDADHFTRSLSQFGLSSMITDGVTMFVIDQCDVHHLRQLKHIVAAGKVFVNAPYKEPQTMVSPTLIAVMKSDIDIGEQGRRYLVMNTSTVKPLIDALRSPAKPWWLNWIHKVIE